MGKAAKGTLLKIGDGATTEVFTTIFEVRDISGGLESKDTDDVTHQTSALEELVTTITRSNEITFQVNWNPLHATHGTGGLRGDLQAGTARNFELVTPAATSTAADVLTITARVQNISPSYPVGGGEVADVTLKPITTLSTYSTRASVS